MKTLIVHIEYAPEIGTEDGAIERNIDAALSKMARKANSNGDFGWRYFPDLDAAYCWEEGGFGDE